MKSMVKWSAASVVIAAFVVAPLVALAQAGADPALDWIGPLAEKALQYVPTKYMPLVLVAWWLGFYVVAPVVKAFVKPDGTAAKGWAVRFAEWFSQDTHRPPPLKKAEPAPAPVQPSPPQGFVTLALLAAIAAGTLALVPGVARGEDPKFGGCVGTTCFAPAVSVNVVAMSVHDGALTSTFDPGIGYGATMFSDKWYRLGVSGTVAFPQFDGKRRAQPALMFSFAEYARIGIACPLYVGGGFPENGQILLGFGADFGRW